MTNLKRLVLSCLLACLSSAQTNASKNADPPAARPGILLLAHGGSRLSWNEEVRHVADRVDLSMPTEIAFGMATKRTLQEGIDRLTARGVTEIIAVPLFISSYSSVITSTEYLLGLRPDAPEDLKLFASMDHSPGGHAHSHEPSAAADGGKPVSCSVPVRMASALNHDSTVAAILRDRAKSISQHPRREVVLLVAHGPVSDGENQKWLDDMKLLATGIQKSSRYKDVEYLTVRDDADEPVRNAATQELRNRVTAITAKKQTVLVVPLLLSYGGIESGIKQRLSGLEYRMPSQGLLPDDRIVAWVLETAKTKSSK
jgi:hypothetical protein